MLRLILNNHDVALSDNVSFEYYRENPFISKKGAYSLDIDINLSDKDNAKIFAGMKRFNSKSYSDSASAELYDGARLVCKGTAIVLSKDDNLLKLQIVSDNSELNYICENSDKARSLPLGSASFSKSQAIENANLFYPQVNFTFPQILAYNNDRLGYPYLNCYGNIVPGQFDYDPVRSRLAPQPFLLYYVSSVIDALGYRLVSNSFASDIRWRRLIMVNPYLTSDFARMLPDWTVSQLVEELEHFFGGFYIVDSNNSTARFVSVKQWYQTAPVVYVNDNVLDNFDIEFLDGGNGDLLASSYDNVAYKGDSSLYWKAAKVTPDFISQCSITKDVNDFKTFTYFVDDKSGVRVKNYGIASDDGDVTKDVNTAIVYQLGHLYDYIVDPKQTQLSLSVYPSAIGSDTRFLNPVVTPMSIAPFQNFWDAVSDGIATDETRDYMNVAFYVGMQYAIIDGKLDSRYAAPSCITSYYTAINTSGPVYAYPGNAFTGNDLDFTLQLNGSHGRGRRDFSTGISIDASKIFKVTFKSLEIPDPKSIFVIKGRKFVCRTLKKTFGFSTNNYIYGEFYAMQ